MINKFQTELWKRTFSDSEVSRRLIGTPKLELQVFTGRKYKILCFRSYERQSAYGLLLAMTAIQWRLGSWTQVLRWSSLKKPESHAVWLYQPRSSRRQKLLLGGVQRRHSLRCLYPSRQECFMACFLLQLPCPKAMNRIGACRAIFPLFYMPH